MRCPHPTAVAPRAARLAVAGLVALLVACDGSTSTAPLDRVVLITLDTVRADHLGSYGGPPDATPHLDALAARGVRFEVAVAPTPLTMPSHATLMTGLDPPRHGVRDNATFRLADTATTLAERFQEGGLATAAFIGSAVLDRQYGLAQGFDVYGDRMPVGVETVFAERPAALVVDEAIDWLGTAPERFFLWVHLYDPHTPYTPPAPFDVQYRLDPYQGEIAAADAELGRLFDALDARFEAGSLVVVTSDHGEALGAHGEGSHSYTVFEGTQRVPLLVAGPGVAAGATTARLARLADLAPTLLAGAGLAPLADPDGVDLWPWLRDPLRDPGEQPLAYLETLAGRFQHGWSPVLGLRGERFKLLRTPHAELYDLRADPAESYDRAASHPEQVAAMNRELAARLGRGLPVRPNLEPGREERDALESLGYVVGTGEAVDLDLETLEGPNPTQMMAEFGAGPGRALRMADPKDSLAALGPPGRHGPGIDLLGAKAGLLAGDPAAAAAFARSAAEARPQFAYAHVLLGDALARLGRHRDAEAALDRGIALDPGSGEPFVIRGRIAEAENRTEDAERAYRQAAEARRPSAEGVWRLAALRLEAGDEDAAAALLDGLPGPLVDGSTAAIRLARAEWRAGRREAALARLEAALSRAVERTEIEGVLAELRAEPRAR